MVPRPAAVFNMNQLWAINRGCHSGLGSRQSRRMKFHHCRDSDSDFKMNIFGMKLRDPMLTSSNSREVFCIVNVFAKDLILCVRRLAEPAAQRAHWTSQGRMTQLMASCTESLFYALCLMIKKPWTCLCCTRTLNGARPSLIKLSSKGTPTSK